MLPGPALIVKCPHCKGEKQLSSLLSGNTFGARMWSDNKVEYPMLIQNSFVQQCPTCGKYYFLEDAKQSYSTTGEHSSQTGKLDFHQAKDACKQLMVKAKKKQIFSLRILVLHSFNDILRTDEAKRPDNADIEYFFDNCRELLQMPETNDTLKAELYREIGEFDKCLETLNTAPECQSYEQFVREEIRRHAVMGDAKVFEIPEFNSAPDFGETDELQMGHLSLIKVISGVFKSVFERLFRHEEEI